MSARKRSRRPVGSRLQRRSLLPRLEDLEIRLVLSQNIPPAPPASGPPGPVVPPSPPTTKQAGLTSQTGLISKPLSSNKYTPPYIVKTVLGPDGKYVPLQSSAPVGYTPLQVQGAYGISTGGNVYNDNVLFGTIKGDGAGQTIAVIDAGDNTGFQDTGTSGYQGSGLQVFDQTFGLPDPPSFMKYNQTGGTTLPAPVSGWGIEISLDVEWAHSIAPMAKIDLVEGNSASTTALFTAMETAGTKLGASVISMSFGAFLEYGGDGALEPMIDSEYLAPTLAANPTLTLLASSGDDGSSFGPAYPSVSPYVAGVGGTSLFIGGGNTWQSETGWSGSGGGISNVYSEPSWQKGIPGSQYRTDPDVSAIADPNTGVAVYDPGDFTAPNAWIQVGGTSLASPVWAGIIAIADQGRVLNGNAPLAGPTQTLPALYQIYTNPTTYAADFHDITSGPSTGLYSPGIGYDLVTGIGSPIVNKLVTDLVAYGAATSATIEFQPPSDVVAGGYFGTAVQALNNKGAVVDYLGTATISLESGPAGATFNPVTVDFDNGTALLDQLSLNEVSTTTPYVFQITVASEGATLDTLTTGPVYVTQGATPGVGAYYPLPLDQSLRGDITSTQSNAEATNDILFVYPDPFPITTGQILLQNPDPNVPKVLNFVGQGQSSTIITSDYNNRLFEITGTNGTNPSLTVVFQDLTLTGGVAHDEANLPLPGILSLGGAILMNGGVAALTDVAVKSNVALGQTGAAGSRGSLGGPAGPGTNGGAAQGGGIYLAAGSITLNDDTVSGNVAEGGLGGVGGKGGAGGFTFPTPGGKSGGNFFPISISGGQGGGGGKGGTAAGGAFYVAGGNLTINGGTVVGNTAQGGAGGTGGQGGRGGTADRRGGDGGVGGGGAAAAGGAIYLARGTVVVNLLNIQSNVAAGGVGGAGGSGGEGGVNGVGQHTGLGGGGGRGAAASGGGLYLGSGNVTWGDSVLSSDSALGGMGGANATGAGQGENGSGAGGGIYAAGALNLAGGVSLQNNTATSGGGIYTTGRLTLGPIAFSDNTAMYGGAIGTASKLTVNGATFSGDSATDGGAIYATAGLVLNSGTFTDETASDFGGALDIAGPITISGGTFSGNSASTGGALYAAGTGTITGASLSQNTASVGGAVAIAANDSLTVNNQTLSDNTATANGGAIANAGTLTLSNATFTGNTAAGYGGGLYEDGGTATISQSSFSNNSGNFGGGIGNEGGTLNLNYVTFSGNMATGGYGGAIGNNAVGGEGSVSLIYGMLGGNNAEYGGAIANYAAMTVANTTMSDNGAAYGGAVQNAGNLLMTNTTLGGNLGGTAGGGVYNDSGTLTTVNVTIAENVVATDGSGGGLYADGGVARLYNTIVAANTVGQGTTATPSDISTSGTGTISAASSHNLIGTGGSGGLVNETLGNLVGVANPGLATGLANNGGQNPTIALEAGSMAIDGGSASIPGVTVPTLDQRGAVRGSAGLNGGLNAGATPDIGAYEASSSFLVTTSADNTLAGTLRSAVAWSNVSFNANPANLANPAPNTVVFNNSPGGAFVSPQTIILSGGTLVLSNTTTGVAIAGPGASQVTISGNNTVGVIQVEPNTTATVSGVTITAGSAANGAGADNLGTLTVKNAAVILNASTANGGGIDNSGTLYVINSQIGSNSSAQSGGGIANESGGTLSLSGATVSGNSAASGGGLFSQGTLSITGTTFSGNAATGSGGGLASESTTPLTVSGSTFTGNTASSGGGVYATGTVNVTGSTFSTNSAAGPGGGITSTGNLTVANSTFTGNTATGDGGAIDGQGTFAVNQSAISGNKAGSGGGIADQGTGTITDSNLTGNSATTVGGGGVYNAGTLTVIRSTLSTNAGPEGGALYNSSLSAVGLTNSTLANNTAATGGAGIYNLAGLTTVNSTIAYNNVTAGTGGGLDAVSGSAALYNTIVALNTHGTVASPTADDIAGSPATVAPASAYNLIGTGGSGGLINGNNGNVTGVASPGLGSLASNGGPMQTVALLAGSPAIDAGSTSIPGINVPIGDERGAERGPLGLNAGPTVDIGAYEASSSYQVTASADSNAIGTLRTALAWGNVSSNANPENLASPAPNTVDFNISTGDPGYNSQTGSWTVGLSGGPLSLSGTNVPVSIVGPGEGQMTLSGNNVSGVITVGKGVTAAITGLTITDGLATAGGGGISNSGTLSVSNVLVTGSTASSGGGIANQASGVLSLSNVSLTNDFATTNGGGLANAGALTLSHSSLTGNTAAMGGAIFNSGSMSLSQSTLSGNTASSSGGGIANAGGGALSIVYVSVSGNQATGTTGQGGGASNSGNMTVTNSTFSGNTAATAGGGIENQSTGTLTLTGATLAGNSAVSGGAVDNNGTSFFINSTVAYNVATSGTADGLDLEADGRATLYNTIVALNPPKGTGSAESDIVGTVSFASMNNLVGTGGAGGMKNNVNGNLVGVSINTLTSTLGPLANYGGPTETVALLAGSPAIDAGVASILGVTIPATDERGAVRGPAGLNAGSTPDIGAYEASSSFVVTSAANTLDAGTLPTAVSWADFSTNANPANVANPAPDTIVFDTTGLFSSPQTINLNGFTLSLSNPKAAVSISGPGGGIVTISGDQSGGVFTVPSGATVTLAGITISGGLSAANGGGVDNLGNLTVSDSTVSGNSAQNGGGIANETGGTLTVFGSAFSGNTASGAGGGIDNAGTLVLTNSTLAGNSALMGGGIANSGKLTAVNDTIAYNVANSGGAGGGLDAQTGGTALLANTIVASNTLGSGTGAPKSDIAGTVSTASAYNLIGTGGSGGLSSGINGNQVGVADPGLASLGNSGGPTQTIALLSGSPARNNGSANIAGVTVPSVDQRGALRNLVALPNETVDIGAYQVTSSYVVTSAADSLITGTLRSAVDWADSNVGSGPDKIYFDTTGTFSTPHSITLSANLGTLDFTNTTTPLEIFGAGTGVVSVSGGGAVGVFSIAPGVTVTMQNLTISAGSANSGGGISNSGNLTITATNFNNNAAVLYGGAIYNIGGVLNVSNSTFTGNTALFGQGGAIDNAGSATAGGTLNIANSSFTGGNAFQGGAINNKYGVLTVTGSNFQNNTGTEGGAIFNNAMATVTGSTIANNVAHDGGGIANDLTEVPNQVGTLQVSNSTIADNSGGNDGGGINSAGTTTIVNSTIAYNFVVPGGPGGGIAVSGGTTTLYNTIVALNTAGTGSTATPNDVGGTLASASMYNLIGSLGGGLTNAVNNNIVKPVAIGLAPLANNGGPLETVALLSTSPAINAGANSITGVTVPMLDERGALSGPAGGLNAGTIVDIGAYEATSSYLVNTTADGTTAGTLREAVSWANQSTNANPINVKTPAPNTIVFDTTHAFLTPQTVTLSSGPLTFTNTTTPIAITGSSASANPITISGGGLTGVFSVSAKTNVTMSYLTITGGSANSVLGGSDGGGVDNFGTLTVSNSTVTGNSAINGGGIANELGGTLALVGSTVANNTASTGGGVYNVGTLSMTNSTIANNTASLQGGGIYSAGTLQPNGLVTGGVLTAINTTIAYNSVSSGGTGGGLDIITPTSGSGTTTPTAALDNTIVALNTVGATTPATASNIAGTVSASSANNLIGTGGAGGLTNGTKGNQVGVANPGLGQLANNGGTTKTIALLAASPAVGKGAAKITGVTIPTTDQRGVARPSTSIDIGAFQYSTGTTIPIMPLTTHTTPTPTTTTTSPSSKLVVGTTTPKPSAGSAAKLHAAGKSKGRHSSLAKKTAKAVKSHN